MSGLRTPADYLRACEVTKAVLDTWDPYSLLAHGAPSDEFEACAARVVTFIPTMTGPEDAIDAVSQVFCDRFERGAFPPEQCMEVGTELFQALCEAGLVSSPEGHR